MLMLVGSGRAVLRLMPSLQKTEDTKILLSCPPTSCIVAITKSLNTIGLEHFELIKRV
jgi:hypothetical protein